MESLGLAITLVALVSGDYNTKQGSEFPYVVSIHRDGDFRSFLCAGSLIASRWVLTTAHCLTRMAIRIRYSNMWSPQSYNYSVIRQRIRHKNSRSYYSVLANRSPLTPKANNIGLALVDEVSLTEYARLSGIDYLALIGYEVSFMEFNFNMMLKAMVYQNNKHRLVNVERKRIKGFGFGQNIKVPKHPKHDKKHQGLKVNGSVPMDNTGYRVGTGVVMMCEDQDFPGPTICVAEKCIGNIGNTDSESVLPDYGSPLTHDGSIVGIATEVDFSYSMYTPVSPYLTWINAAMEGTNPC